MYRHDRTQFTHEAVGHLGGIDVATDPMAAKVMLGYIPDRPFIYREAHGGRVPAKLAETCLHSSWMVVLSAVPLFAAYGIAFDGGPVLVLVLLGTLVGGLLFMMAAIAVIGLVITLEARPVFS